MRYWFRREKFKWDTSSDFQTLCRINNWIIIEILFRFSCKVSPSWDTRKSRVGSEKYLLPKQQKIQFRRLNLKQNDGSTFLYQTLLKTRPIIWTTRAGLSTIQSGYKLTTKYGCDTCRTQATFICTFYRNQFQSNGDFRNIWCIWYLSEPSVNKTCFARIFRLFRLFPITVILVSRLLLTKKVRKMTDLWEFPDLDSNWQNLSLQDLWRLFS